MKGKDKTLNCSKFTLLLKCLQLRSENFSCKYEGLLKAVLFLI